MDTEDPLIDPATRSESYGSTDDEPQEHVHVPLFARPVRGWSVYEPAVPEHVPSKKVKYSAGRILQCIVYAGVNVIIGVPALYGYAAVIFNHEVFQPHMNALSKLVLFSSLIHQLGFTLFSSLPYAIGMVQDAGLIFLASMSTTIAKELLAEGASKEEVLSTTLALLASGTASLGFVLMLMGKFKMADAVSYLPMPVVGGYLAFIGYFCFQAGVGLCISEAMTKPSDWKYILDPHNMLLAFPGLLAGIMFCLISRRVKSDTALPIVMAFVPLAFYVVLFVTGTQLEAARDSGWVGEDSPSVPVSALLSLVDFKLVHWSLVTKILFTWVGMVLVVSFASCLDVAAISMDMGEALDTNQELATVGVCNLMSGLTLGFTGSYIFSQTIFTFRTGLHSRLIGVFIMFAYVYLVVSPINVLEVAPLFFLGSTLIFIGVDIGIEWAFESRHKMFLSEYLILLATFVSIQVVGMDAGIVLGVLVSLVDHVFVSASTTSVSRVMKQSRAVWSPEDYKVLQNQAYHLEFPRIMTLEVVGTVFFGSSFMLFQRLVEEVGLASTRYSSETLKLPGTSTQVSSPRIKRSPKYVVLDLSQLSNLDATGTRGCFLQFVKMCAKKGITVCAAGATPRTAWMLRSHEVAFGLEDENRTKGLMQADLAMGETSHPLPVTSPKPERILLFITTFEALEFCENVLLRQVHGATQDSSRNFNPLVSNDTSLHLSDVFAKIIGANAEEASVLKKLDGKRYHETLSFQVGEDLFVKSSYPDAFYVLLKGAIAVAVHPDETGRRAFRRKQDIVSGAGPVQSDGSSSELLHPFLLKDSLSVVSIWPVGSLVGYVDFLLQRPRVFRAMATQEDTVCAALTHSNLNLLRQEDEKLDALVQRVLLQSSVLDLANCTCEE